jgi:hypothetical protein
MKRNSWLFSFVILSVIAAASGACRPAATEVQPGAEEAEEITPPEGEEIAAPEEEEAAAPMLIEASIDDVEIVDTNFYRDVFGEWRVCGLLTNLADYPVASVEIALEFLDSAGASIHQETSTIGIAGVAPGETIPFSLKASEDISSVGQVTTSIVNVFKMEFEPATVNLSGTRLHIAEEGIVMVTGEIENPSDEAIAVNNIATALFSSEGEFLFTSQCDVCTRYLAPGETGPFRILMYGYPKPVEASADFQIFVSAVNAAPRKTFELGFSEYESTYLDSMDTFHVFGDLQNKSADVLEIHLLNTLYDADGNVIDASTYDVLPGSLAPGESAPYDLTFGGPNTALDIRQGSVSWKLQLDLFRTRTVDGASYTLATTGDTHEFSGNWGTFSGMILNDSGGEIQIVLVVAGLRDKNSGNLVGLGRKLIWEEIPDGGSIEYSLQVTLDPDLDPSTLEHFLIARGR